MTVHAGDDVLYKPARGEPVRARVHKLTAKRVMIVEWVELAPAGAGVRVRYVKAERLQRAGGGC